jgi:hypothetical protein
MEGKNEEGVVFLDGWIVSREHWCDCGCNLCRMGEENGGLTSGNINRNIFTTLMFYETEFRMACRKQGQKMHYRGHSSRRRRFLEIRLSYFH